MAENVENNGASPNDRARKKGRSNGLGELVNGVRVGTHPVASFNCGRLVLGRTTCDRELSHIQRTNTPATRVIKLCVDFLQTVVVVTELIHGPKHKNLVPSYIYSCNLTQFYGAVVAAVFCTTIFRPTFRVEVGCNLEQPLVTRKGRIPARDRAMSAADMALNWRLIGGH